MSNYNPNYKDILINNVLFAKLSNKTVDETLALLRREKVSKPTIYIGAGTCGLGAGAGKTLIKTKEYLTSKNIDADIIELGCIGLCSSEPLLDVQLPNKARISFENVNADKVNNILDDVFRGKLEGHSILGQFKNTGKKWNNVQLL